MNSVRHLVSKKKRRYKKDGFDLDLSYITKNIIAMGFPSEGTEGLYRNKMSETQRFLETKHKDHYKVYNLCSEDNRVYDHAKFHGRVAKFPFPDHNAPPFSLMEPCCADAAAYLGEDESNVIALHCKAGKGRTGVMTCALLMHMGAFKDAQEALDFYGKARTKDGKGVTIPSQTRFVKYYGQFMQSKVPYTPTPIVLKSIRLVGIPNIDRGTCIPFFTIRQGPSVGPSTELHTSAPYPGIAAGAADAVLELSAPCTLAGDIKVEFFHQPPGGKKKKMCFVWFNTFFEAGTLRAEKLTIDKAAKDKKCKVYPKDFAIEFTFQDAGPPAVAQPGGGGPGAGPEASADPKIITHVTNL